MFLFKIDARFAVAYVSCLMFVVCCVLCFSFLPFDHRSSGTLYLGLDLFLIGFALALSHIWISIIARLFAPLNKVMGTE
jgi:hypothetical protein